MEFFRIFLRNYSRLIRLSAWEESDKSGVMDVVLASRAALGKPKPKRRDQHIKALLTRQR